jgi:hypothetical protein
MSSSAIMNINLTVSTASIVPAGVKWRISASLAYRRFPISHREEWRTVCQQSKLLRVFCWTLRLIDGKARQKHDGGNGRRRALGC